MTCGIYLLRFKGTEKVYIGQSLSIENRYTKHLNKMRKSESTIRLNEAYSTYGEPSIEVLETCIPTKLDELETLYIKRYDVINNGFNAYDTVTSSGGSPLPGELNGNSTYSDTQVIEAFNLLITNKYTHYEISEVTGVSHNVVSKISGGTAHKWLEEKYPEEYKLLISLKGKRNIGDRVATSKYSNEHLIEVFNAIVNNPSYTQVEIAELMEVPRNVVMHISNGSKYLWLKEVDPVKYEEMLSRIGRKKEIKDSFKEVRKALSPNGEIFEVSNIRAFSLANGLDPGALGKVLRGTIPHHKQWKKYVE